MADDDSDTISKLDSGLLEPLGFGPPIVGIGASAGGIQALRTFFKSLPERTGVAFVVIVHLAPEHHSELPHILAARTKMPVSQVNEAVPIEADHVYVTPPDRQLEITTDNHIAAVAFEHPRARRAPIDIFFRSLAEQHGDGFAIILSGAGSDGSAGLKFIREAGGIILVQDPDDAEYGSMPRNAIATGLADFIVPVRDMGQKLAELVESKAHVAAMLAQRNDQACVKRILSLVRSRTGHDFSQYKKSTVLRRMQRRAQVTRQDNFADYFKFLRENVEEVQALLGDLLISVTTFFRDPKAFEALATDVVPRLFADRKIDSPIRVWVPGCATGEEAYSIAILLLEEAARHESRPELQVFASDLDVGALGVAREGRYPTTIAADVSDRRLLRFFSREGDHYRVKHELRETVLFASHSLLKDPPFSRLDLISCRNLLIYLDRELQHRACGIFHYALNSDGFLFLGSSESAETPAQLFRVINRETRIYQSAGRQAGTPYALPQLLGGAQGRGPLPRAIRPPVALGAPGEGRYHRQSLETTAPPSVLVDDLHRAINLSETAGRFVQPPAGPLSGDISDLVRPELRFDLRAALIRAFERRETTLSLPIMVRFDGERHLVYVQVRPLSHDEDTPPHRALVFFIEGGPIDEHAAGPESGRRDVADAAKETVRQLREELALTQNRLKSVREGSETTTEELRAANEELQSINEEYRSTSEELETSKEELQSINEELQTVNAELKDKLESVSRAHNDLQNLMAATDVGVLFLDNKFRIKRFTPHIKDLFNVTYADEGRPVTDFTHQLEYDGLFDDVTTVLRDLSFIEREVASRARRWYLLRLRPYRTLDNKIDGVVVTFIDVTERRATEEALRRSDGRLRQMIQLVELSREPVCVWEFDNEIIEWNRGSETLFGYSRDEALGRERLSLMTAGAPGPTLADIQHEVLEKGSWNGEVRYTAKDGRPLTVEARIELFPLEGRRLVLETNHDITERKTWEHRQQLLLGELTHRVKNTLTVVQSMAHQTQRGATSIEDFVERFDGRLDALASAHKLLVDSDWKGAELGALVRQQLGPYAMERPERIHLSGEAVLLPAHLATPFGLVLHELATNAAKHGSLSLATGGVELSWRLDTMAGGRTLTVTWREHGGPPVKKPATTSFGRRLIQRGLPDATVQLDFASDGVVCTITLPLHGAEVGASALPDSAES